MAAHASQGMTGEGPSDRRQPPAGGGEQTPRRLRPQLAVLVALIGIGGLLHALDLFDWREALQWARGYARHWWLAPLLVAAQVLLFAFALPGTTLLWLVAPLYAPPYASAILTLGGTLGAAAAYFFARRMTAAEVAALRRRRAYALLEAQADFALLLALRLIPAFPHSVINYSAGVLRLPLAGFLATAALGFAAKSYLYASVIHAAARTDASELARPEIVIALIALAALALAGRSLRRRR